MHNINSINSIIMHLVFFDFDKLCLKEAMDSHLLLDT